MKTTTTFRDLLIRKGIDVKELTMQARIPADVLTGACMNKPITEYYQRAILKALSAHYGLRHTTQALFTTRNY